MSPPVTCGVVVFDYPGFVAQFPMLANSVTQPVAQSLFDMITTGGIVDNTPTSIIRDIVQRATLLNMAVAHVAVLSGYVNASQGQTVGRVSAATQGSVSVTLDYQQKGGATQAWWNQTPYGAMYYMATLTFRTAFWNPAPVARFGAMIPGGAAFYPRRF